MVLLALIFIAITGPRLFLLATQVQPKAKTGPGFHRLLVVNSRGPRIPKYALALVDDTGKAISAADIPPVDAIYPCDVPNNSEFAFLRAVSRDTMYYWRPSTLGAMRIPNVGKALFLTNCERSIIVSGRTLYWYDMATNPPTQTGQALQLLSAPDDVILSADKNLLIVTVKVTDRTDIKMYDASSGNYLAPLPVTNPGFETHLVADVTNNCVHPRGSQCPVKVPVPAAPSKTSAIPF